MMRPGALVLALVALGGLIALRMWTLAAPALKPGDAPDEVQALFDGLTQAGRLSVGEHAQLLLPEPDLALAAAWQGKPLDAKSERLLRDLDGSAAGVALRSQIIQWNRGRCFSAVRDDGLAHGLTLGWRAHDCTDGHLLASGASVSESFGYIHQGRLQLDLGQWTEAAHSADCMEWRADVSAPKPALLRVLFIGHPSTLIGNAPPSAKKTPAPLGA